MATEILAAGTTEAGSSEITLLAGESATISLKPATAADAALPYNAAAQIQKKTSDTGWLNLPEGKLDQSQPAKSVLGPGTFRGLRRAGPSLGMDRD